MSQKITFYYTEFKNCPEATEISYSRERGKIYQYMFCVLIFIMSLLFVFCDSADRWLAVCGVILCPVWFVYLMKYYDDTTNKMIKQALERNKCNNLNNKYIEWR